MKIGMLWYDNSQDSLKTKIRRAVEYYTNKYGARPTLVYTNPADLENKNGDLPKDVEIKSNRSVLPNHLWIGMDDK